MAQLASVSYSKDSLNCPRCQSYNFKRKGSAKGKPKYKCSNCGRYFTKDSKHQKLRVQDILPKNINPIEMKQYDAWDLRLVGKKPTSNGQYSLHFSDIEPVWLRLAIKEFCWMKLSSYETSTLKNHLMTLKKFAKYVEENHIQQLDIDRDLIVDFINLLNSKNHKKASVGNFISHVKDFLESCKKFKILELPVSPLIYDTDYPKRNKPQVKDIPQFVLEQLSQKTVFLAEPIKLLAQILQETGMRVEEVCSLTLDCIQVDSDGDWWISVYRRKLKKEDRLFISKQLAIDIQNHQQYIKEFLGKNFRYLFCTTEGSSWFGEYARSERTTKRRELNHFIPVNKKLASVTIRGYLHQLAHEYNIKDKSGKIYPIWRCHQFRHTHLTDLARKGTGIAHIMQRAGHGSPQMTMEYIHLTDDDQKKKMKEVWDNTHFNMEGEIVAPVNPDLDTAKMQWIKKGMGMQTTDNGYCTLLWTQTCPHQDLPCKGCGSWVTTLDFLDSHKQELEETEKIIENARQKGYQRQIEKNVPRADRLKKIISGMEKHQTMRGLGHNEWEEKE